jgi:hypothetical protein
MSLQLVNFLFAIKFSFDFFYKVQIFALLKKIIWYSIFFVLFIAVAWNRYL